MYKLFVALGFEDQPKLIWGGQNMDFFEQCSDGKRSIMTISNSTYSRKSMKQLKA